MVFCDVDPKNKNKVIEQEEVMQVDEAWIRDEFPKEDVRHAVGTRINERSVQLCHTTL
jgi:hypothetical protein